MRRRHLQRRRFLPISDCKAPTFAVAVTRACVAQETGMRQWRPAGASPWNNVAGETRTSGGLRKVIIRKTGRQTVRKEASSPARIAALTRRTTSSSAAGTVPVWCIHRQGVSMGEPSL